MYNTLTRWYSDILYEVCMCGTVLCCILRAGNTIRFFFSRARSAVLFRLILAFEQLWVVCECMIFLGLVLHAVGLFLRRCSFLIFVCSQIYIFGLFWSNKHNRLVFIMEYKLPFILHSPNHLCNERSELNQSESKHWFAIRIDLRILVHG